MESSKTSAEVGVAARAVPVARRRRRHPLDSPYDDRCLWQVLKRF